MRKSKIWAGFSGIFAVIFVLSLVGQPLALANSSYINTALGTSTSKIVDTGEPGDTMYYKSAFGDFDDPDAQAAAMEAAFAQNIEEMREGAVLLKNDNHALPMKDEVCITVLGHGAVEPAFQASAAGTKVFRDSINVVTLRAALEEEGFEVNETVWDTLENKATAVRGVLQTTPWGGESIVVSGSAKGTEENKAYYEALQGTFADYSDAAIVVFTREGAEGTDLIMDDIDDDGVTHLSCLALHQNERDLLELARANFSKVVVLLNSPYPMEVHELNEYADAVVMMGYPGHKGFTAVAEILRGAVNPSGHLTDTYATSSLSAPAVVNSGTNTPQFANVDEINATIGQDETAEYVSFQAEGIYIGYRYYETRYADLVMGQGNANGKAGALSDSWNYAEEVQYPFGYGLSYTSFEQKLDSVEVGEDTITVKATATNTGDVAGKSVVQVYAQTPYGDYERENKVEKSAVQLVGFAKTGMLDPGASESVEISVDKYLLASYDYVGVKGYYLSEGDYAIAIGSDVHEALNNILAAQGYTVENGMTAEGNAANSYQFTQSFDAEKYRYNENGAIITNQFEDCDINYWLPDTGVYLTRSDWEGTFPVEQTIVAATPEMMDILDGEWYEKPADAPSYAELAKNFGQKNGMTLAMMKDVPLEDRETWLQFIYQLQPEDLPNATAESFQCPPVGDLSPAFPVGDGCDSVQGTYPLPVKVGGQDVNLPTARYCSNVILTGSFNTELYANRGRMMGEDGLWSGHMVNYNVGNDLHRTPFGGRNFEYMSECPTLNYLAAIPQVVEMEKTGSHSSPKHFVGNDQEFYRSGLVVFFNEQAFREGSLRAFEGSVRMADAGSIMQSFERLGLKWSSASYALNTVVLRNEWNWHGLIDTDAAPCFGEYVDGGYVNHAAEVLDAGTQEWCLDGVGGHAQWVLQKAKDTDDGHLLELLTDAAIYWEYAISRSNIINGMSSTARVVEVIPWWQNAISYVVIGSGILTALCCLMLILSKIRKEH